MVSLLSPRVRKFALAALIGFVLIFLLAAGLGNSQRLPFDNEKVTSLSDGWRQLDSNGNPADAVILPAKLDVAPGQAAAITHTIPTDVPGPIVLCFRSSQQQVRVYFEGELLYSLGHSEQPGLFGKSPGSAWNLVRLPEGCGGGQVIIEQASPYPSYSGSFSAVMMGTKAALLFWLVRTYILSFALTLFIFGAGVIMVVLHYLLIRKSNSSNREMLYLGWFAILIAIWMFGETRLAQFFVSGLYLTTCITFCAMLACPVAIFKYIACAPKFRYRGILAGINLMLYLLLFAMVLLQAFNLFDFVEMMPVMHTLLLLSCAVALTALLFDWLVNHNTHVCSICLSLLVISVFFLMEVVSLYLQPSHNTGDLMRVGVLVFILLQAQMATRKAIHIMRLSRLATTDALTGCQNRTAYLQRLVELDGKPGVGVIMADLNNLKTINDSYGHNAGDDALIRCARCFTGAFARYGDCYRIGGDEFVFLGASLTQELLTQIMHEFEQLQQVEKSVVSYPFCVAVGCTIWQEKRDQTLNDTVRRADRLMYRNKRKRKAEILPAAQPK